MSGAIGKALVIQAAREECANWVSDRCIGIVIQIPAQDGEIKQYADVQAQQTAGPDGACLLSAAKPCPYFERAVLPALLYREGYVGRLSTAYGMLTNGQSAQENVRLCQCGEPLPRRKRWCADCSKKRRHEQTRNAVKNARCKQTTGQNGLNV